MKIDNVKLITFSPTHTSKQVGEAIVRGMGIPSVEMIDVTFASTGDVTFAADEPAVVVVPVYGGHVAPLALKRMEAMRGQNTPVVAVVVYGNRAYEKALIQLEAFLCERGFKTIAAGTFIGEHSYSTEQTPIAVGRPDAEDIAFAEDFGRRVMQKVGNAPDAEHLYGVNVARIPRPKQPLWPMLKFVRQILKWRKSGVAMPRTPQADAERCKHCARCVSLCPNGAIVKGDECSTITERCIKCCACVKGCPHGARTFDTPFAPLLSTNFKRRKENKTLL